MKLATEEYKCLPEELAARLAVRGRSWPEMREILGYYHLQEKERKAREKAPNAGTGIQVPAGIPVTRGVKPKETKR